MILIERVLVLYQDIMLLYTVMVRLLLPVILVIVEMVGTLFIHKCIVILVILG